MNKIFISIFFFLFLGADLSAGDLSFKIDELTWMGRTKKYARPKVFELKISDSLSGIFIDKIKGEKIYFRCKILKRITSTGKSAETIFYLYSNKGHFLNVNPGNSATAGGELNGYSSSIFKPKELRGFSGKLRVEIAEEEIYPEVVWKETKYKIHFTDVSLNVSGRFVIMDTADFIFEDTSGQFTRLQKCGHQDTMKIGLMLYVKKSLEDGVVGYKIYFLIYRRDSTWTNICYSNEVMYFTENAITGKRIVDIDIVKKLDAETSIDAVLGMRIYE